MAYTGVCVYYHYANMTINTNRNTTLANAQINFQDKYAFQLHLLCVHRNETVRNWVDFWNTLST